jgi:hypothetical protein
MAHYLVKAKPYDETLEDLKTSIRKKGFEHLKPFGPSLSYSLEHAKIDSDSDWIWEELDYCSPPLKQEREQVLDRYFRIFTAMTGIMYQEKRPSCVDNGITQLYRLTEHSL